MKVEFLEIIIWKPGSIFYTDHHIEDRRWLTRLGFRIKDTSRREIYLVELGHVADYHAVVQRFGSHNVKKIKLNLTISYPIFPTEHHTKPITGWRTWSILLCRREGEVRIFLGSIAVPYIYTGPISRNNRPPIIFDKKQRFKIDRHHLGFYARKDVDMICGDLMGFSIIGKISMFGKVIEHERGYRSQSIRIDHLSIINPYISHIFTSSRSSEIKSSLTDGSTWKCFKILPNEQMLSESLKEPFKNKDIVEELERSYGCEVRIFRFPKDAAAFYKYYEDERA